MKKILVYLFKKLQFFNIISVDLYFKLIKIKFIIPIVRKLIYFKVMYDLEHVKVVPNHYQLTKSQVGEYNYWVTKKSLLWHLYTKVFVSPSRKEILINLENIIHFFPKNLNYFELGCGYPTYLHSNKLKEKIKNYYGQDPNEYLVKFFSLTNVFSTYPTRGKAEVILRMGGVLKYLCKEELTQFLAIIKNLKTKIIVVTHPFDTKILNEMMTTKQLDLSSINSKKIEDILIKDKIYLINFDKTN
jgi:hypothetical protein